MVRACLVTESKRARRRTLLPDGDRLLTTGEVAARFGVDVKSVTRWAKAGLLSCTRTLGGEYGHRRFRESHVEALLKARSQSNGGAE